jgi:phosphohistidine phosphatase SixA
MKKGLSFLFMLLIGLSIMVLPTWAQHSPKNQVYVHTHVDPNMIALAQKLQKGGYAIFFRHERTALDLLRDQRPYNLSNCTGQRMLSPAGIEASREIGQAFKLLKIPVANVLSSPLCRTKDTAKFAFAQVSETQQLMGEDRETKRTRETVGNDLKQLVNQKTQAGKNLILVGHFGSSLALDRVLSEGEALVLKPAGNGQVEIMGQITSAQWGDVVRDVARMQTPEK